MPQLRLVTTNITTIKTVMALSPEHSQRPPKGVKLDCMVHIHGEVKLAIQHLNASSAGKTVKNCNGIQRVACYRAAYLIILVKFRDYTG